MRQLDTISLLLLIIGGLNWLLIGLFQFDLVAALFGGPSAVLSRAVYLAVGLCAVVQLIRLPSHLSANRYSDAVGSPTRATYAMSAGRRPEDGR